ncbi:Cytochrome oxidase maturation protein cbb3-type [Salinisphaera shabanensis E1L3A]|jgi:cbb3-type cytochrome oxidase maturation protein|uniref:Cytochrome oxidase maturation protein cbb3-type n=1 Tax=Salinisphaera shabanensis E1L3A TaxID=1033802 RepID=U2EIS2_9GAMM|nr:cbb3-type cytochrome oxidase assembly protein CcoS [Salinisphaera shabanensis]ERJ18242.1 Cytochrome oxidase maturation protein cbb3-type [Salinisphaera shabanensis E1L3A]
MTIVLVLLPLTLLLVGVAVWAFFWAVGDGQFDDMDSPAYRILLDDDDWPSAPEGRKPSADASAAHASERETNDDDHSTEPPR